MSRKQEELFFLCQVKVKQISVLFWPCCISGEQRKHCVKIWSSDKFKNSCMLHSKYSKYLPGSQPHPLCWEQDMTLVENTLLICLFIPSVAFLSVLSVRYAAHPLLRFTWQSKALHCMSRMFCHISQPTRFACVKFPHVVSWFQDRQVEPIHRWVQNSRFLYCLPPTHTMQRLGEKIK